MKRLKWELSNIVFFMQITGIIAWAFYLAGREQRFSINAMAIMLLILGTWIFGHIIWPYEDNNG